MPALRGVETLVESEAELNGAVAVAFLGLDLRHHTGTHLEHGGRIGQSRLIKNLRHSQFLTDQPVNHRCLPGLERQRESAPSWHPRSAPTNCQRVITA